MKLGHRGELGFLEELGVFSKAFRRDWVGPGDDAAVIPSFSGGIAFSSDLVVEDVHFRRSTATPEEIGFKALAVNVSDMAAMGAKPVAATVNLTVPAEIGDEWFRRLYGGMAEAEKVFGCPVAGGDLSRSAEITIGVAIIGECAKTGPLLRSGAKPGHEVYVTGDPGESGAGLALLERGLSLDSDEARHLVSRHKKPSPRVGFGRELARRGLASAAIDVSDGIARDCLNIAIRSKVRIEVELAHLPVSAPLKVVSGLLGLDPVRLVLGGGEDYELLFTADPSQAAGLVEAAASHDLKLTRIGRVAEGAGAVFLAPDGREAENLPTGFDHLCR